MCVRQQKSMFVIGRGLAVCAMVSVALVGCSKKNEGASGTSHSQIVARVGDQIVSMQELDTELRWNNPAADRKPDDAVIKQVLGELVARKYLLQRALEAKLDREPTVLSDILRSREQVLARAYATREVSKQANAISTADTERYITDHPDRFANRKLLAVELISLQIGSTDQSLIDSMKEFSSLEKIEQRLTELGIANTKSSSTLSTSDVPDDLLRSIKETKLGDVIFFRSGKNGVFLTVKSEQLRPIEGASAITFARQLQQQDLVKAQASLTNFTANMEAKYEAEYAKIMGEHPALPDATN
jgi:EpsD family peptidyl-prolyl cis-trans isomerase